MDVLEEHYDATATLTHQEIVERFQRLFGREMTSAERRIFFLPESTKPINSE
jgi:hypothetical protein